MRKSKWAIFYSKKSDGSNLKQYPAKLEDYRENALEVLALADTEGELSPNWFYFVMELEGNTEDATVLAFPATKTKEMGDEAAGD